MTYELALTPLDHKLATIPTCQEPDLFVNRTFSEVKSQVPQNAVAFSQDILTACEFLSFCFSKVICWLYPLQQKTFHHTLCHKNVLESEIQHFSVVFQTILFQISTFCQSIQFVFHVILVSLGDIEKTKAVSVFYNFFHLIFQTLDKNLTFNINAGNFFYQK